MLSPAKRLIVIIGAALGLAACEHSSEERGGYLAAPDFRGAAASQGQEAALVSAEALRRAGKPIEALSRLAEAHRRAPADAAIASAYGRMALLLGHDDLAGPLLAQAVAANPKDWRALSAQGVLDSRRGRLPDGRRALDQAKLISMGEAVILNNLAVSHLLEGKPAAAASLLRQGLASPELRPDYERRLRRNLALALAVEGRFAEADRLAGAPMPRDLAGADGQRLARLLGVNEAQLAALSGWKARIARSTPASARALQ
jgi:Flp pilus assembly protein TadD